MGMSLLDTWNEEVVVFPEVTWTSPDGNLMTGASQTGIRTKAMIQVQAASGTSARRSEQDNEGFESEENYRVRFPRRVSAELASHLPLGPQSRIQWRAGYWALVGFARRYNGSRRTAHHDYTIRRA
jgi:hypothetical protein